MSIMTDFIIAALILTPLAFTLLLKSNAALGFLTLCGSFVVVSFAGADLKSLTGQLNFRIDSSSVNLIILMLPTLITLLSSRKSVPVTKVKGIFNVIIATCAGGLLALVCMPILNNLITLNLSDSVVWELVKKIQAGVIGAGFLFSLFFVWSGHLKHASKKHK